MKKIAKGNKEEIKFVASVVPLLTPKPKIQTGNSIHRRHRR